MDNKVTFVVGAAGNRFEVLGQYTGTDGELREWFVTSFNDNAEAITVRDALQKAYELGLNDGYMKGMQEAKDIYTV